ncbi:MAG: polysaccharide deacetylase family protein, partial [Puniceicoccales bacterium]|nr:polysaccharide deacetylase family protein [Puniceicoccales bacterium]
MKRIAFKIDVDTAQGTRHGVPYLGSLLRRNGIPATFFFSLGPDNTGKSIRRFFQPGFLRKVWRTRVPRMYSWKTLLYGTILPAPHIAQRYAGILRQTREAGFSVGIHAYDHFRWQNYVRSWSWAEVREEFSKSWATFLDVLGQSPQMAGAPGWQTSANGLRVYDEYGLLFGSDCRGSSPFFPKVGTTVFRTLQIPTTLPTLDEWLGDPRFPNEDSFITAYLRRLMP